MQLDESTRALLLRSLGGSVHSLTRSLEELAREHARHEQEAAINEGAAAAAAQGAEAGGAEPPQPLEARLGAMSLGAASSRGSRSSSRAGSSVSRSSSLRGSGGSRNGSGALAGAAAAAAAAPRRSGRETGLNQQQLRQQQARHAAEGDDEEDEGSDEEEEEGAPSSRNRGQRGRQPSRSRQSSRTPAPKPCAPDPSASVQTPITLPDSVGSTRNPSVLRQFVGPFDVNRHGADAAAAAAAAPGAGGGLDAGASAAALLAGASWGAAADPSRCQLQVTWRRLLGDPEPVPVLEGVAEWTGCPTQLGTDAADASSPLWIAKSKLATLAALQEQRVRQIKGPNSPSKKLKARKEQGDQPAAARPPELLPNQWVLDTKTDTFTEFIAGNQDAVLGQLPPGAFLASGRDGRNVLKAVRLVAEGEGEEVRGGALFAQLQHSGSGTPVASFQGVKIGIQSKNTILLHSGPLPAGAQHTLPEFVAMCHEFPASDFDALHGGLDKLLASCRGRTVVTGGKELPEGTLLRHISMGDFLVVWDPRWGGGPAKKYYLPQPPPQLRGRCRLPGPPGLPTKTGKAEWDVSQLQAHRVQLVLDLTERRSDGKPNFKLVQGAQPVTPLPQPPPGLQWSGLLDGASSGGSGSGSGAAEGSESGCGGVHAWRPLSFRETTEA